MTSASRRKLTLVLALGVLVAVAGPVSAYLADDTGGKTNSKVDFQKTFLPSGEDYDEDILNAQVRRPSEEEEEEIAPQQGQTVVQQAADDPSASSSSPTDSTISSLQTSPATGLPRESKTEGKGEQHAEEGGFAHTTKQYLRRGAGAVASGAKFLAGKASQGYNFVKDRLFSGRKGADSPAEAPKQAGQVASQ